MTRRFSLLSLGLLVLSMFVWSPAAVAHARFPETISLPNGWQPEGIVIGRGSTIYAGSIPTGAIYQADLRTGEGSVLVPAQPGRMALGLSFDRRTKYLFVAGGPTGAAYVYDTRNGANVAEFQLTTEASTFVNDVIVTRDAAYFTDSFRPVLYRIDLSRRGKVGATVTEIPLSGDIVFVDGAFNANGIEATPRGDALILVSSELGTLYRVDPDTGESTLIDLGGVTLDGGDGIVLKGRRLYVVQNFPNQIAVVKLDRDLGAGTVTRILTDSRFDVPATIDIFGKALYVVNARFTTPPTPDTPYTIERVSLR